MTFFRTLLIRSSAVMAEGDSIKAFLINHYLNHHKHSTAKRSKAKPLDLIDQRSRVPHSFYPVYHR